MFKFRGSIMALAFTLLAASASATSIYGEWTYVNKIDSFEGLESYSAVNTNASDQSMVISCTRIDGVWLPSMAIIFSRPITYERANLVFKWKTDTVSPATATGRAHTDMLTIDEKDTFPVIAAITNHGPIHFQVTGDLSGRQVATFSDGGSAPTRSRLLNHWLSCIRLHHGQNAD